MTSVTFATPFRTAPRALHYSAPPRPSFGDAGAALSEAEAGGNLSLASNNSSMIPISCRLFGQDHASNQRDAETRRFIKRHPALGHLAIP